MTTGSVHVDRHIRLPPRQRSRACHDREIFPELSRVQGVTKGLERGQAPESIFVQAIEVCEVTRLIDAIYIGFFWRERDILLDFGAYIVQKLRREEIRDHTMLVTIIVRIWSSCSWNVVFRNLRLRFCILVLLIFEIEEVVPEMTLRGRLRIARCLLLRSLRLLDIIFSLSFHFLLPERSGIKLVSEEQLVIYLFSARLDRAEDG